MKHSIIILTFFIVRTLFCVHPILHTPYNSELKSSDVRSMDKDSDGRIWIASRKGLIFWYFNNFFFEDSTTREDMKYSDIMTLEVDLDDNVWISYNRENELAKFNKVEFQNYRIDNEIGKTFGHDRIYDIVIDSKNNPWFETLRYFTYFDGENWESIEPWTFISSLGGSSGMALDSDDNLWFATTNDSIYYFKNDTVHHLDLSNANINEKKNLGHLYIDKKNNLYFSNNFRYIDENQSSRDELFQYNIDTKEWKKFDTTNSPMKLFITEITEDVNGHIWVLTNRQIYRYDFVEWHFYDFEDFIMNHPAIGPSEGFSYLDIEFDEYNNALISASGAGVLELIGVISSVEDEEEIENEITLFPNPTESYIQIENGKQIHISNYEIIDLTGKTVKKDIYSSNQIDISNLSNGVYFIKLYHNNTFIQKKFMRK